jgi:serine protease Do
VSVGLVAGLLLAANLDWITLGNSSPQQPVSPQITQPLAQTGQGFTEIAKAVKPAVVNISTTKIVKAPQPSPHLRDPFFRDFFGEEFFRQFRAPRQRPERSLGSGVVVSADGYILTNNHVIEQADEIKITLPDKREFRGTVVGTDSKTDLAVLKIDAGDLPTIPWGDSDKLQVGEFVLAVGSPFGLTQTVTMGIISAVGRANVGIADYEDFIQTDAAINPGNSGGPLINVRGELIGINTAIFSRSGGYMGIGFAVPSNMVRSVMESLIQHKKVVRGWLGVSIQEVSSELAKEFGVKDLKGALVGEVTKGSPAEKAGIKRGDVITQYNGKQVEDTGHLRNMVAQTAVGSRVAVTVFREKKKRVLDVTVGELPKDLEKMGREEGEEPSEAPANVLEGIQVENLTREVAREFGLPARERGVVVTGVRPGSAAEAAGLRPGDLVQEVNRQPVASVREFRAIAAKIPKEERALLYVNRGGRKFFVPLKP